ncbi:hypothetical protein SAMN05216410_2950 [Sanguibacter gelidistatuariae]|uniref:Uncharacterized protein n=1 Tax=Sanguibacter gelidistatuariae TaxID=1814289 RepID=A0A1G6SXP7_9MICO|nr:hypothetical protein SAMN05216410_2950 [Sanguibacter gelidistatuariae]
MSCPGAGGWPSRSRCHNAMRSGTMTRSVSFEVAACQATIRCENTSMMNATYVHPAHVLTYVKSVTQTQFGAVAVKSLFSRSPARIPSLAGMVVRTPLSRRTPDSPSRRMPRSTAPGVAGTRPWRRRCAVILRRP